MNADARCKRPGAAVTTMLMLVGSVWAQPAPYAVDFGQPAGQVKALNGTNIGPLYKGRNIKTAVQDFKNLNFSTVRLHDVPLDNAGMRLVDYQMIFGNLDADPKDPKNYYFEQTDDYLKTILDCGPKIIYRLGPSIEWSEKKYFVKEPKDHAHFAEICAGIVRHYNSGWANGHRWNIAYWEIWNEPNLAGNMWDTGFDTYVKLYVDVAKRLKSEFPEIKVGGPVLTHADRALATMFVEACRKEGAPLDFFSWHGYIRNPSQCADSVKLVRKILDDRGFAKTELHFNEWHYFPCEWSDLTKPEGLRRWVDSADGMNGIDSAAFNTLCLTRWQDVPLDMANFYATGLATWGLRCWDNTFRPTYYSLQAFGRFVTETPSRVKASDSGTDALAILAGTGPNGEKQMLVTAFKAAKAEQAIKLAGVPEKGSARVWRLDATTSGLKEEQVPYADGVIRLATDGSTVLLVRF